MTKPFEDPFDRLTVLSKVEGLKARREIEGRGPPFSSERDGEQIYRRHYSPGIRYLLKMAFS